MPWIGQRGLRSYSNGSDPRLIRLMRIYKETMNGKISRRSVGGDHAFKLNFIETQIRPSCSSSVLICIPGVP